MTDTPPGNTETMSHQQDQSSPPEQRAGRERRLRESRPPSNGTERRRLSERRQISISEISYFEWATHFVKFHGRSLGQNIDRARNAVPGSPPPPPAND